MEESRFQARPTLDFRVRGDDYHVLRKVLYAALNTTSRECEMPEVAFPPDTERPLSLAARRPIRPTRRANDRRQHRRISHGQAALSRRGRLPKRAAGFTPVVFTAVVFPAARNFRYIPVEFVSMILTTGGGKAVSSIRRGLAHSNS